MIIEYNNESTELPFGADLLNSLGTDLHSERLGPRCLFSFVAKGHHTQMLRRWDFSLEVLDPLT